MKQFFKTMFACALGAFIAFGIIILGSIFFIIGVAASAEGSSTYSPDKNTVFRLTLKGTLSEQISKNPFFELFNETSDNISLSDIIKAIRNAKTNGNIKGIYIEAGDFSSGFAGVEAIHRELLDFKKSGKFIVSYSDNYTQGSYYVCSVADSVFLNPQGSIGLIGLASRGLFFTGLAEKLGIEHYIFKVGTYKSAVEPYFLKKFSDANREQLTSILNSVWENITNEISSSRKIPTGQLEQYINGGFAIGDASNAIDFKLADALRYRFEAENSVKNLAGQKIEDKLKSATIDKVISINESNNDNPNKIAVLYAEGEIIDEASASPLSSIEEQSITEDMADQLRKLKEDKEVKAVVFRVNSPGGSAYISEQIWKQVKDLKAVKPIVVSMGDYAASGGYYISCAANKIVAERTTLTGSIGVFGVVRNLTGTFEKLGLTTDMVKTNTYADLGDASRPMRDDEKVLIQHSVERTYDLFLTRCADGRKMTKANIDSIGQGRVWTGEQALQKGLVDKLGGIDVAIKEAASLAKLKNYSITVADEPKDFLTKFLEKKINEAKLSIVKTMLGSDYELFSTIQRAKSEKGIIARMPLYIKGI